MPEHHASEEEIRAAALQFVRKVSGFHHPSSANEAAFQQAIEEITRSTERLLEQLPAARSRPVSHVDGECRASESV